jgi:hypothetical protein
MQHLWRRRSLAFMSGIFISYRQADAKAWAISLRDDLAEVFGDDQVFLDKDTLHAGNWRAQIQEALERCKVVLVAIGPRWLTVTDEQNRLRIQLEDDVHRQEIALALSRPDVTVIPVLFDEAKPPNREDLPLDLRKLCDQQARKIGDSRLRRQADLRVLVQDIQVTGGLKRTRRARPLTMRAMVIGMVVVAVLAASIWLGIQIDPQRDWIAWVFIIGVPLAMVFIVAWLRQHPLTRRVEYEE